MSDWSPHQKSLGMRYRALCREVHALLPEHDAQVLMQMFRAVARSEGGIPRVERMWHREKHKRGVG